MRMLDIRHLYHAKGQQASVSCKGTAGIFLMAHAKGQLAQNF